MASGRGGTGEESAPKRASVFSRLGTKGTLGGNKSSAAGGLAGPSNSGANPSGASASGAGSSKKRDAAGGPGPRKNYLLGHRSAPNEDSPTIDPNWENWDEKNLDHDDEYMLEKKRQLLKKELGELVTPVESEAGGSGAQAQVPVIPATARTTARSPVKRKRGGGPPAKLTRAPPRRSSSSSSSGSSSSSSSGSSSSGSSSDSGRVPRKKVARRSSHLIRSPSHSSPERVKGSKRIKSGKRHKLVKKTTKSVVKGAKGGKPRAVNSSPKRGPQEKKVRGSDGKVAASQSTTAIAPPKVRQEPDKFGFYCTQAPAAIVEPVKLSSGNKSSSTKESRSKVHSQVLKRRGTPRVISASTTASSNLSPNRMSVSSAPFKDRRSKGSASLPQGKLSDPSSPGRHDKRSPSMDRRRGGPHHDRGLSPLTSSNTRLRSRSPRMGMSSRRVSRSPLMDSDRRGESFEESRMLRDFSPRAGRSREGQSQFSRGSSAPRHYRNASPLRRDTSRTALRSSRDRSPMVGGAGLKRGSRDARQPQLRDDNRYGRGESPDDRDFRDFDRRSASGGARGLYDDRELRDPDPRDLRRDIGVKGERRFDEGRGLNQGRGFPRGTGAAGGGGGGGSNRADETWDDRSFRDARDDRRFNESRPPTQSGRGGGLGSGVRDSWTREEGRDWPDESPGWRDRSANPGGRGGGRKQGGGGRSSDRGGNNRGMLSRSSERGRGNNDKSAAQLTGANSVRVAQPRGRDMDWTARRRSPPMIELQRGLARDHRSQSNERLLPPEALTRGSRERSISRDRTSAPRTLLPLSEGPRKRSQSREMSRPKDPIRSRPASIDRLDSQSEPADSSEIVSKKRSLEEEGEVDEEVLPSAKKVKLDVSGVSDAELSSKTDEDEPKRTAKVDMQPIPASPKPLVDENAEDISDIGDSDDEILNKDPILDPSPEEKLEPALEAGELTPKDEEQPILESRSTPTRALGDKKGESKLESAEKGSESLHSNEDKMDNDLLEGISDEDLALSDEDEIKTKAKIADALGADWSELMSRPEEKAPGSTSLREKWSLLSIVKSVGISKNLLGPEKYAKFLEKVNKDVPESEQFKPVSDLAGLDVTRRRNALEFNQLYAQLKPYGEGLTGLKDRAIRRRIQGYLPLPPSETPKLKTSSEWHEAALKLLRDKMAPLAHP
ncbi:serine/arginine repetitive matrix protein 2-like isoform X1 [Tigriopus californicus]|uniref:serine/arginine repetitive matrix protein 2-like isoform X1 n=1 Tax=Tigriopus californicus TaxID=6832 RepID=UPI0027DA64D4|nr:serine/arginine repetitive matrix protein 2-like isoform X1 [Tigriopus californicus]